MLALWFVAISIVPIIVTFLLYKSEKALNPLLVQIPLNHTLNDVQKKVIDGDTDLAKTFITFSLAILGVVAYYVKTRIHLFASFNLRTYVAGILVVLSSIVSIAFGHWWLAAIRDQLANDIFNPFDPTLGRAETGQYVAFICSLVWAGFLIFDREVVRTGDDKIG